MVAAVPHTKIVSLLDRATSGRELGAGQITCVQVGSEAYVFYPDAFLVWAWLQFELAQRAGEIGLSLEFEACSEESVAQVLSVGTADLEPVLEY